jgi:hypothetical protein
MGYDLLLQSPTLKLIRLKTRVVLKIHPDQKKDVNKKIMKVYKLKKILDDGLIDGQEFKI